MSKNTDATNDDESGSVWGDIFGGDGPMGPSASGPALLDVVPVPIEAPPSAAAHPEDKDNPTTEEHETCLQKLNKVHTEWDRKRREFEKVARECDNSENTKSTPMLQKLRAEIGQGSAHDDWLMNFEREGAGGAVYARFTEAGQRCGKLVESIKKAQKLSSTLRINMKVEF